MNSDTINDYHFFFFFSSSFSKLTIWIINVVQCTMIISSFYLLFPFLFEWISNRICTSVYMHKSKLSCITQNKVSLKIVIFTGQSASVESKGWCPVTRAAGGCLCKRIISEDLSIHGGILEIQWVQKLPEIHRKEQKEKFFF